MAGFCCFGSVQESPGNESPDAGDRNKKRLTGERFGWYRVASHLRIPVDELRTRLTFTEFLEWLEYLQWEENKHTKEDFYLAQIAAEVRRGHVEFPRKVKVQDFLVQRPHDGSPQSKMKHSKQAWATYLAIDLTKN